MALNDDDTVYCDVQMPVKQGRELLQLVTALRDSRAHPNLDTVFAHMQLELAMSIDIVENPQPLGAARPTKH
jgi:CheY-like chemotaxis protein